jgi:hypothetical protein
MSDVAGRIGLRRQVGEALVDLMHMTARVEDPTHLVLSEPLLMPRGSIVAVDVHESALVAEHADWVAASGSLLESAYGPNEPDYSECGERLS